MHSPGPPTDPNLTPATGEHHPDHADGQRAWLAQLDRKVGTRTYAGAAALILALAAGIVAIVMATDARDNSATKAELTELTRELTGVEELATEGQGIAKSLTDLTERVDSLESEAGASSDTDSELEDQLAVVEDDIEDLRQQIDEIESAPPPDDSTDEPAADE